MYIIGDTEEQKLEMFIEEAKREGRDEERINTEREREAKECERKRADNAESELEKYKAIFGPLPQ